MCPVCSIHQSLDNFNKKRNPGKGYKKGQTYYQSYCKLCESEIKTELRLRRLFNISTYERAEILAVQESGCAICRRPAKSSGHSFHVDHDHTSGLVRGLLCWTCNRALGYFRDKLETLKNAVEYLSNPPASKALDGDRFGRTGRITKKSNVFTKSEFDVVGYIKEKHKEKGNQLG